MKTKIANGKHKTITWKVLEVPIDKIKPTPNNYKLLIEEGLARFRTSIKNYGLAGSVIVNADYTLIDGNTRLQKAKELGHKKIWASVPDRKLTPKEFSEFSAMYDMARAGEADVNRIKEELGTTKDFFKTWGFEIPKEALAKLEEMEQGENVINGRATVQAKEAKEIPTSRIALLFTQAEAAEYIDLAESLYKKLKADNVTDLSLKALRFIKKLKS